MYKVVLKNVGKSMVNRDFIINANSMNGLLAVVYGYIMKILGADCKFGFSVDDDEVLIIHCCLTVGSFSVTKL